MWWELYIKLHTHGKALHREVASLEFTQVVHLYLFRLSLFDTAAFPQCNRLIHYNVNYIVM